ncbi:MAG: hypothetical protein R3C61_21025 [Bacteroidia bacterium]
MLKTIVLVTGILGFCATQAQDLIIKTNKEEISAEVLEIGKRKVLYQPAENPEGEPQIMLKKDLYLIVYEGGMEQYFQVQDAPPEFWAANASDTLSPREMYYQGIEDAKMYFYRPGHMWGTFGATAYYPLAGVFTGAITGGIIAAIPPDFDPSLVPNPENFRTSLDYREGFTKEARRVKLRSAAKGFGLGMIAQGAWIIIAIAVSQ